MSNKIVGEWELLLNLFHNKQATLVQIGANDGVSHGDEYLYSIVKNNALWKKILIEPVEENMNLLKKNYQNSANIYFEQIAIGALESHEEMYINTIENDGGLFGALSTFKKDIALKFFSNVSFKKENIKTMNFSYIIEKYNIKEIDILQSDTEGYDGFILNQIFDLGIFPKILKVETGFMTQEEAEKILKILHEMNYNVLTFTPDLIASKI